MKTAVCLVIISIVSIGRAGAEPVSIHYPDILKEARRIEKLEGSEYVISKAVRNHRARLNLRAFGKGSDSYYVDKKDGIAFTCKTKSAGFNGGVVEAVIVKHEAGAEGSNFFELDNCTVTK